MIFIIGGAYQGKLDFVKENYKLADSDIYFCSGEENEKIDFSKACIYGIEKFVYTHPDALEYFKEHKEEWRSDILVCRDIFCGVVPLGEDVRAWRKNTGRLCRYFSEEADKVSRIFCGLEQKLK